MLTMDAYVVAYQYLDDSACYLLLVLLVGCKFCRPGPNEEREKKKNFAKERGDFQPRHLITMDLRPFCLRLSDLLVFHNYTLPRSSPPFHAS